VVGVTWVHSSTGVRVPVREIAAVVEEANRGRDAADRVLLVVDGVHGLAAIEGRPAELGCDFFCAGTHKWVFAPRGTGFIWGRPGAWERLRPVFPSFSSLAGYESWMNGTPPPPNSATVSTPGGFTAYEHQWAMVAAFRFQQAIGPARAAARIRELNQQLRAGLAALPRVRLHTPKAADASAGIVCFEVDGLTPDAVVKRLLERKVIASTSPYNPTFARLSASLVNDPAEVDAALGAVRAILAA
jgi:selenocysteine lyase/cysteine desulfurase